MKPLLVETIRDFRIGILDTPCFPARFYAGYLQDGFWPLDNSTENFFRTLDEAILQLDKLIKKETKENN